MIRISGGRVTRKKQHHLWAQALKHVARLDISISSRAGQARSANRERETAKMMDHERQERDLQGVFDATRASYRAAIENTFALQERTLQFARALLEAPQETLRTQAEDNRATLQTLAEESRRQREAMENLVRESAKVYESFLRSPFPHRQSHPKFEEATEAPEVQHRE
jgi:uncharacterized protein (DUF342 family)